MCRPKFVLGALLTSLALILGQVQGQQFGTNVNSQSLSDRIANFGFIQQSNRSISGTSQSITNMNGQPGSFFSGTVTPFVIGVTPVVGGYPTGASELGSMAAMSQHQKLSGIMQGNIDRRYQKVRNYLRRAELAESEGDIKRARANYGLAYRMAEEPLRSMIRRKLQ